MIYPEISLIELPCFLRTQNCKSDKINSTIANKEVTGCNNNLCFYLKKSANTGKHRPTWSKVRTPDRMDGAVIGE